jgi:hypothetical protein
MRLVKVVSGLLGYVVGLFFEHVGLLFALLAHGFGLLIELLLGHRIHPVDLRIGSVGTLFKLTARINSPKPGIMRAHTAAVASGVTSRGEGPVPPVVTTRQQPRRSTSSHKVPWMINRSSGMTRASAVHGDVRYADKVAWIAGPPLSS